MITIDKVKILLYRIYYNFQFTYRKLLGDLNDYNVLDVDNIFHNLDKEDYMVTKKRLMLLNKVWDSIKILTIFDIEEYRYTFIDVTEIITNIEKLKK